MLEFWQNLWVVYYNSAPYLLLGFIIAGALHQWVKPGLISNFVKGGPIWSCVKAVIIGTPVPLCSCGVVPVALSLHREGAGRHSTVSFLVATPENGVDSLSVSYSLFGGLFTVIRLLFAMLVALICGLAVYFFDRSPDRIAAAPADDCCASESPAAQPKPKTRNGFRFIVFDFLPEIALWLTFGFILSALIATFLPPTLLQTLPNEWGLIAAALIGLPLYVCASASTPIALSLFAAGLSPGACLVFLVTGPATNAANIPLYIKELGTRTTLIFYGTLFISSIVLGHLVNLAFTATDFNTLSLGEIHEHSLNPLEWLSIFIMAALLLVAIWHKYKTKLKPE
ncbi:permease [Oligoflexaceae bacterium]|nr:permease [Oligoflexaceae bacterium]